MARPPTSSRNLQELGFEFRNNKLCSIANGAPFTYDTGNSKKDSERYGAVASAVMDEIYKLMETRGLQRLYCDSVIVPNAVNEADKKQQSFVYASSNAFQARKLLILIHGGGEVRAGIWSRRVIINDGLNEGSQLPYIDRALREGYGVVVLNGNSNSVQVPVYKPSKSATKRKRETGTSAVSIERVSLPGCESPERHAAYVWKTFISGAKAKQIVIVAHSYGGHVTMKLAATFPNDFLRRVSAVCFTDSVHCLSDFASLPLTTRRHLTRVGRNWVTSNMKVGTPCSRSSSAADDVDCVSAGDIRHEWTSHAAFDSVFSFISELAKLKPAESHVASKSAVVRRQPKAKKAKLV